MKVHRENLKIGKAYAFAYNNISCGPQLSKLNFC